MCVPHQNCASVLHVPVPGHPNLLVIALDQERYPPATLDHLVQHLAAWLRFLDTPPPPETMQLSTAQVKQLLRVLRTPQHPALDHYAPLFPTLTPNQLRFYLQQWFRIAIDQLEQMHSATPDIRGTILRMRFAEGRRAKAVMQRLHLSKSHFYRLQAEGLHWLAERLVEDLRRRGE